MEQYAHITSLLALTMGASWAAGLNLYATLAMLGLASSFGQIELPADLQILQSPLVIGAAMIMYVIEFITDKIPGLDSAWDSLHTFIRIPAGAMLAAGAIGDVGPVMEFAVAIMGGGLATTTHLTKAGSRAVINTSPEPFSNWTASVGEDVAVFGGLYTALNHPTLFLVLLFVFMLFVIWLLPKIWSAIKGILGFIGRLFGANSASREEQPEQATDIEQLTKLKALLDSGALTEAEYEAQKQKILR